MLDYQREFIEFAISENALSFGEFTLKSGRISPYFFNAGCFHTGRALDMLGRCYANAIERAGLDIDVIFGPAYKGIPLASVTSLSLATHHDRNLPFAFNRKEAKDHGEGGQIVGAELAGRIAIIDDVITAGTAIREVMALINGAGATAAGVIVALDRQERGQGETSAIQEVEAEFGMPVVPIVTLDLILEYLETYAGESLQGHAEAIRDYRARYGVERSS
ncbi:MULTISPECIES: orotate phosphoribosyltransferase [Larsenimonas]|uniref:Orotate phosphoribosyltransferase n=1 Tax=Larsenimonas suaedae TaxID=1851019 RepID=A0ABU1GW08_9GAMM|nr:MULTISPECIES: orotate phosphoribosyltransferase [Larsenimonas]MCM2973338.1 orotate phosphoribosyltransferase [Larsenimonas suaedae]MCM5705099.1 orotate phosphoribosyltransferase [Larsenimonas salina]MDR5896231.1 orotate phosphoribosyltransferase [Larsenimonas suaedae]